MNRTHFPLDAIVTDFYCGRWCDNNGGVGVGDCPTIETKMKSKMNGNEWNGEKKVRKTDTSLSAVR